MNLTRLILPIIGYGLIIFLVIPVAIHAQDAEEKKADQNDRVPKPIQGLVAGFNAADPQKMGSFVSDDCQVWYVGSDGKAVIGSKSRKMLVEQMQQYFQNIENPQSKLSQLSMVGRFVTARESVSWRHNQETKKQFSLVVFELSKDQKEIAKVWYYPAQK